MFIEQRREPREPLALPLKLGDGNAAVTRNISPSGMYFEIAGWHFLSGAVVFEMHLTESSLRFTAEGEIVRVEHSLETTGVAVRLLSPRLHLLR